MHGAPHPFTLRQLQYAVAVADELSFRKAAERCRVAQPSLSAQIAQLEDALGTRLFERGQRRVLVTAAGRALLERARALLVQADDLGVAARRASDPLSGPLRIGVIPTISPYLLPSVAPRLRAKLPRLRIAWREDKTATLLAALDAGELDAALLALDGSMSELVHETIAVDRFLLAVPRNHPLAEGAAPVAGSELRRDDVLLLDDGHCFRDQALEVCTRARAHESELRATSLATLVQMVAGGAGITLLPALSAPTEARAAGLATRPIAVPSAQRTIALVWRRRSAVEPALRSVAEIVREAYPVTRSSARAR
ncbi:MAG: LysR substrate-binding domain-containing protein [Sandaracinus sp.]